MPGSLASGWLVFGAAEHILQKGPLHLLLSGGGPQPATLTSSAKNVGYSWGPELPLPPILDPQFSSVGWSKAERASLGPRVGG